METRQNLTDLKQLQNTLQKMTHLLQHDDFTAEWHRCLATLNVTQEYTQNRKTNQTRVIAKKCTADEVRSLTQIDCNIIIIIR